ncbi:hypothetical protein FOA52_000081 [Chlamydomonas sp. UWO 241]|nr:hypothetical protein FOA52_000081 [Chlamydomonas sp. UWO 241]
MATKNFRDTLPVQKGGVDCFTNTVATPYTSPDYKIPGFTGHLHGMGEVHKKTPIKAQMETKEPGEESFLHTRSMVQPVTTRREVVRDPCNDDKNFKKAVPDNLWAHLQTTAVQESFKPPVSNIALGDSRIDPFKSAYSDDFRAPFAGHDRLRSPNRNEDLAKTTASLVDIYKSSYNRVGDKSLQKMITRMRERMDAKCGNSNDNAFRIRKLFLAWDKSNNGMVHFEDLRQMCESFGMQLADDDLLALYCVYDPEGTGYLAYMDLVQHLMHPDTFRYYVGAVDNSQSAEDRKKVSGLLETVHKKFVPVVAELQPVLAAFDEEGSGYLSKPELLAGCASLGVVVSDSEFESLKTLLRVNDAGKIDYVHLCSIFA